LRSTLSTAALVAGLVSSICSAPACDPMASPRDARDVRAPRRAGPAPIAPTADAATPHTPRYAVAAENAVASKVALDVLARGGSAADAAVAGVLAVGVAQPVSSGIGGGGFAVVWDAKTRHVTVLDFREHAPIGLRPADLLVRPPPENRRGAAAGVPGEVAGLVEIHKRWGRWAFADVVRPAADLAEAGFPVSAHLSRTLGWADGWLRKSPRYDFLRPFGAPAAEAARVKNPRLGATLRRIAAEGRAAFYSGVIARDVVDTARSAGGRISLQELESYAVVERAPLRTSWEGYEVFTMPPPSGGGLMILQTLHMHAKADLARLGHGSAAYVHLLAETFRGSVADRVRAVGDPAFVRVDVDGLAARARMQARRSRISMTKTTASERFTLGDGGTSHLVAVDGDGNVVSITSTVNNMFGSKLVTEGGFVLNDELDDFTPEETERRFGLSRGPNSPRGGARPASSMTPTLVLRSGEPVLALGGSGGMRIPTSTTQVLLAHLVFDRPVAQAVRDARFETPSSGGLSLDATFSPQVVHDLSLRGEVVDTSRSNFSAVQAVSIQRIGGVRVLEAAADPRKGGAGLIGP
jgi:gamma-glutamyltranspeptidase / glutathione hydrolase